MTLRAFAFGPGSTSPPTNLGLLILRLGTGLSLAFAHGVNKIPPSSSFIEGVDALGFPLPVVFAWAAGLAEFLGGLLLAVGLLTKPAALFVAFTMGTAFFMRHAGDPFGDRELAFLYLVAGLALSAAGAGRYSLDAILYRRQRTVYS